MGLLYTATFRAITLTANGNASQDLFELVWPSGVALTLHDIQLDDQYNVDERIDLALMTRTGTGSGGSSAITPTARNTRNTVASAITSFKTLVTTPGTGGTLIDSAYQWSALSELERLWTPEMRLELSGAGGRIVLNNANTFVAASRIISGSVTWEER